jgi:hypothetical protein
MLVDENYDDGKQGERTDDDKHIEEEQKEKGFVGHRRLSV